MTLDATKIIRLYRNVRQRRLPSFAGFRVLPAESGEQAGEQQGGGHHYESLIFETPTDEAVPTGPPGAPHGAGRSASD